MMLHGRVFRDGPGWAALCDAIGAFTQGRTRKEAFAMLADVVELRVGQKGFRAKVHELEGDAVLITGSNLAQLFGGLLRYQRQRRALSLAEAAQRVGVSSASMYARMESGMQSPRLDTMDAAIAGIAPELALTVGARLGAPCSSRECEGEEPANARPVAQARSMSCGSTGLEQ